MNKLDKEEFIRLLKDNIRRSELLISMMKNEKNIATQIMLENAPEYYKNLHERVSDIVHNLLYGE